MKFTLKDIQKLSESGKILGYKVHDKNHAFPEAKLIIERKVYSNKEKQYIYDRLCEYASKHNTKVVTEFKFHPTRKFRFDFAMPELQQSYEYEGIYNEKSGHTFYTGYNKDCRKYNLATLHGWKVFRFTAKTYLDIDQILNEL